MNEKNKPKVLIVDDMKENVELMEAYLVVETYEVICAYSGKEALQRVKEEKPDIILLDVVYKNDNNCIKNNYMILSDSKL